MNRVFRLVSAATGAAFSLAAQTGNEIVFAATSQGGSTDPHHFVQSAAGTSTGGGNIHTDNVTDAVWNDTGRNLYVSQSLQNQVSHATWNGSSATWSSLWSGPGSCYGLGLDRARQRLWVLSGPSTSTRELHCLDVEPSSPGYGSLIAQTSSLSGALRERWELSPSGNLAAVPHAFLTSGPLQIVDTDPGSPTFLQIVLSTFVPGASSIGFAFASDCAISADDQFAYVLYSGIAGSVVTGALAVLHIPTITWLDFDPAPGHQDMTMPLAVPNVMDLALDGSFMVMSGQGGNGWAMRIDFDYVTPENSTRTEFLSGQGLLPDCNGVSLSPGLNRVAVTAVSSTARLVIIDVNTGLMLQNVAISPGGTFRTTSWQDASPAATYTPFGSGCPGSLGVPTFAPTPGSRPTLGSTLSMTIGNLPANIAIVATGLSNTMSNGLPLPMDLGSVGMPGCLLLIDPQATEFVVGSGNTATWTWQIPSAEIWFGTPFYQQVFVLDAAANPLGLTVSNAGLGQLGY